MSWVVLGLIVLLISLLIIFGIRMYRSKWPAINDQGCYKGQFVTKQDDANVEANTQKVYKLPSPFAFLHGISLQDEETDLEKRKIVES